jgi:acyl-CoA synthetase (AMP-forming)/AMP-acid ligase II
MAGPIALLAAGLAGSAYLSARFSLEQDLLFLRISAAATFRLLRAERADQLNIFYILEQHAQHKTTASRPFLLFEGKSHTYWETYQIVLKYGAWLRARHGVKEKDIVAVDFQNSDVFIFLWLGLWAIGAKPAFINYNLAGAPLTHSLRVSTAKLALVDPRVADALTDQVRSDLPGVQFVVMTEEVDAEARKTDPVRAPNPVRSESGRLNMALLIYTSGTTGLPKPALVSWGKVYGGTAMAAKGTGLQPADVLYTVSRLRQRKS